MHNTKPAVALPAAKPAPADVGLHHRLLTEDNRAAGMFCASLVFLALLGVLIVCYVDIPTRSQFADTANSADPLQRAAQHTGFVALMCLLALWPVFWLEQLVFGKRNRLLLALLPPLRLAARGGPQHRHVWLPRLGWQQPGRALSRQLDRALSLPMLMVALLILPVLLVEIGMAAVIDSHPVLRVMLPVATGLIWVAFAAEFIVMVGATDRKIAYIKTHWIDLAIILLPLVAFLRTIRVLRLARLAKIQKLAKLTRVYRMRGLLMKTVKALMLLGIVQRLIGGNSQRRLAKLKLEYQDKLDDLAELKAQIAAIEAQCAEAANDSHITAGAVPSAVQR